MFVDINECEEGKQVCGYGAECVNKPGKYECICPRGYTGDPYNSVCSPSRVKCVNDGDWYSLFLIGMEFYIRTELSIQYIRKWMWLKLAIYKRALSVIAMLKIQKHAGNAVPTSVECCPTCNYQMWRHFACCRSCDKTFSFKLCLYCAAQVR